MTLPPFAAWKGSKSPKIVIVGEAWGEREEMEGKPFVGYAGQELDRQIRDARLAPLTLGFTNCFALRPERNDISTLFSPKKDLPLGYNSPLPPLRQGARQLWLRAEFLPEIDRLREELRTANPNLVVGVGATACWALLGSSSIGSLRGTVQMGAAGGPAQGLKVLVTYHPSAIIRGSWHWRPIVLADLIKAGREAQSPEIKRLDRKIFVNMTLQEVEYWATVGSRRKDLSLGVDIETAKGLITCISFAFDSCNGIVVPFRNKSGTSNYWPEQWQEEQAWLQVVRLLECGRPLVFQNGMYDAQWLMRMGFNLRRMTHDTMLLHHSLYPEMQKDLGFLGSIYTNESSWKLMRKSRSQKGEKLDE